MARIAVVGAGIAGLGAAYELQKAGHTVVVLERSGAVGGRMQTRSQDGFTWDAGAQFMLPTYQHMQRLMAELDVRMSAEPIPAETAMLLPDGRRFYARASSPASTWAHPALSWRSKWRLGKVAFAAMRHRLLMEFDAPERMAALDTESLRAWGDREVGADAVDYLLSVPVSTLFFWQAHETPWYFPLFFLGMGKDWRVMVPEGGMGAVPGALARMLDVRLHTRVSWVDTLSDGTACLRTEDASGAADLPVDRVVLAVPAPVALGMLPDPAAALGPERARFLAGARYVANTTTAVAYRKAPESRAYGVGVPLALGHRLAAIGWDHLKGASRAPAGAGLAVVMPTDAHTRANWSRHNDEIGADMVDAVNTLYPNSTADALFHHVRPWEYAMPIMEPGRMRARVSARAAGPAPASPVFACGDYWVGPCTEHALTSALETVAEVKQSLS